MACSSARAGHSFFQHTPKSTWIGGGDGNACRHHALCAAASIRGREMLICQSHRLRVLFSCCSSGCKRAGFSHAGRIWPAIDFIRRQAGRVASFAFSESIVGFRTSRIRPGWPDLSNSLSTSLPGMPVRGLLLCRKLSDRCRDLVNIACCRLQLGRAACADAASVRR